jgi:biopolymer transport protein TolQ
MKIRLTRKARRESQSFVEFFRQRKSYAALYKESRLLQDSHLGEIFRLGYLELNRLSRSMEAKGLSDLKSNPEIILENVDRAMQGGIMAERQRLERFLPLLATTGSTAPFIGLFGTVWGIMTSFQDIGITGAASLAVVAPGISEALIATAIGLGAAIPAVVAYNHFSNSIRVMENEMIHFAADFTNLLKRDLIKKTKSEVPHSDPPQAAIEG